MNCRRDGVVLPWIVIFFMIFIGLFIGDDGIAQYGSYFTHIPSEVAGSTGIALWIKLPMESRYNEGAPVAIYLPGGFQGEGIGYSFGGSTNICITGVHGHEIGGLFFDFNGDGIVNPGLDFIPYPLVFEIGNGYKAHYSVRLRRKADEENLFPNPGPDHIPTLEETESFWAVRNGEYWIDSTLLNIPNLMFMVVGSEIDHVQRALDHPHVLFQYEAFRQAGARLVRVNPDQTYVEHILGSSAPNAVDNNANEPFDHMSIRNAIEPGRHDGELGRDVIVPAGACELADRTQNDRLEPKLDALITSVRPLLKRPDHFLLHHRIRMGEYQIVKRMELLR